MIIDYTFLVPPSTEHLPAKRFSLAVDSWEFSKRIHFPSPVTIGCASPSPSHLIHVVPICQSSKSSPSFIENSKSADLRLIALRVGLVFVNHLCLIVPAILHLRNFLVGFSVPCLQNRSLSKRRSKNTTCRRSKSCFQAARNVKYAG